MIEFSVETPTIPIPFHKLLKVVAIVDTADAQTKQLLDQLKPQVQSVYPFGGSPSLFSRGEIAATVHSNLNEIDLVRKAGVDAGAGFFGSFSMKFFACLV